MDPIRVQNISSEPRASHPVAQAENAFSTPSNLTDRLKDTAIFQTVKSAVETVASGSQLFSEPVNALRELVRRVAHFFSFSFSWVALRQDSEKRERRQQETQAEAEHYERSARLRVEARLQANLDDGSAPAKLRKS